MSGGDATIKEANEQVERIHTFFLREIAPHLLDAAGKYDGKYHATTSLSTHITNTVLIGTSAYVYDAVVRRGEAPDPESGRILIAALTLHDANKFIGEEQGRTINENSRDVLEAYIDAEDPFNVESVLPGTLSEHLDDLLYLIQRTEVTEDGSQTRGIETDYRGLEPYCEIGDAVASAIAVDGLDAGVERLTRHFFPDDAPIQRVQLVTAEQPLLNNTVLQTVKEVIRGETNRTNGAHGLIIGSTPSEILYLGEPIDRDELQTVTTDLATEQVIDEYEEAFSGKVGWNSVEYDILSDVGIPFETKRERLATQYADDVLRSGQGLDEGFEEIPPTIIEVFPELLKHIYIDKAEFDDKELAALWNELKEETNAQSVKVRFIAEVARNPSKYETALQSLAEDLHDPLREDLEPDTDQSAVETAVSRIFGDMEANISPVTSPKEMCFLCGQPATKTYTKGRGALYGTNAHSKRVSFRQKVKHICPVCNLEYELFRSRAEEREVSIRGEVIVVFFYFDEFIGDVRVHSQEVGGLIEDTIDFDNPDIAYGLLGPQYHVQPVSMSSRRSNKNRKLSLVRKVFQRIQETGGKAIIGKPFIAFNPADDVFTDTEATIEQKQLELARIQTYEDLRRGIALFNILAGIEAQSSKGVSGYLTLDQDEFVPLVRTATEFLDQPQYRSDLVNYVETYHADDYNAMKEIAEAGIELYGKQYGSKHDRTSVFRISIEALLQGLNNDMEREDLITLAASKAYSRAERQEYTGHVTVEQADRFVNTLWDYLEERNLISLKRLSDWQNDLIDAYDFTYLRLLAEMRDGEEDEGEAEADVEDDEQAEVTPPWEE